MNEDHSKDMIIQDSVRELHDKNKFKARNSGKLTQRLYSFRDPKWSFSLPPSFSVSFSPPLVAHFP